MLFVLVSANIRAEVDISEVRLGGLFQHAVHKFGRFAAFVMAVHEINNSPSLLQGVRLSLAVKDSSCNPVYALVGAHELATSSFYGNGAHAIIGATCSSASVAAAQHLKLHQVPLVSPSSTSAALSDGAAYPFFARTAPSDAWQSFALADLVEHLLGVQSIATINSDDSCAPPLYS